MEFVYKRDDLIPATLKEMLAEAANEIQKRPARVSVLGTMEISGQGNSNTQVKNYFDIKELYALTCTMFSGVVMGLFREDIWKQYCFLRRHFGVKMTAIIQMTQRGVRCNMCELVRKNKTLPSGHVFMVRRRLPFQGYEAEQMRRE